MASALPVQLRFHAILLSLMFSLSFIGFGKISCMREEGRGPNSVNVPFVEHRNGLENNSQEIKEENKVQSEMARQHLHPQEEDRWLTIAVVFIVLNQAMHLFCFGLLLLQFSRSSSSEAASQDRLPIQQPKVIFGALGLNQLSYGSSWHEIRDRESRPPILENDLPF